jgi:hypothetical protein
MLLQRMFGPKREEVTEGWRRRYNEELHVFYCAMNMRLTAMNVDEVDTDMRYL